MKQKNIKFHCHYESRPWSEKDLKYVKVIWYKLMNVFIFIQTMTVKKDYKDFEKWLQVLRILISRNMQVVVEVVRQMMNLMMMKKELQRVQQMLLWIVFEKKMVKMQSNIVKAAVSMFVGNVNEEVTCLGVMEGRV